MQLTELRIRNFQCFESISFRIGPMHAIVGANNAGKSTILRALDFLFNASAKKINTESFYHQDIGRRIEIEAIFTSLNQAENELLEPYLRPDGSFQLMRTAHVEQKDPDAEGADEVDIEIAAHYCKPLPKIEWLNPTVIDTKTVTDWWKVRDSLVYKKVSFAEVLGGVKPSVAMWKECAEKFAKDHLGEEDYYDDWVPNPKGYSNVLKAALPHFELIPAVRDATDESKVLKTNPFGRLIYEVLRTMDAGLRAEIETALRATTVRLNRSDQGGRAARIEEVEVSIKGHLAEMMPADLELEFQAPTVEVLLTTPKIYIDDGYRGSVENKGHGLQRAVIFAILRAYARFVTNKPDRPKRTFILGVEEPELYMHPTAQRTIRRVLRAIADQGDQVLFSTHSPLLVDVTNFDEIIRVQAPEPVKGRFAVGTTPSSFQLTIESLVKDLVQRFPNLEGKASAESLRERYGHAYTASRNEGFFAKKVVLVEGLTEAYSPPIYAEFLGVDLNAQGIAVVECGGKGQMDRLFRVFNELGITCFVIFDYDGGNNEPGLRRDTELLCGLVKRDIKGDPSKVEVTDRYACFPVKWEVDLKKEIADYDKLIAQGYKLLGTSDSKPLIARYVAHVLTKEKKSVPPSIEEIVKGIANAVHSGSCLVNQ